MESDNLEVLGYAQDILENIAVDGIGGSNMVLPGEILQSSYMGNCSRIVHSRCNIHNVDKERCQ